MSSSRIILAVVTGLGKEVGEYFANSLKKGTIGRAEVLAVEVEASRVVNVLADPEALAEILFSALRSGAALAADLVAIPCNSVHVANIQLRRVLGDRLVSIDDAVLQQVIREGRRGRFLILGTTATVKSGTYQDGLRRIGCSSVVLPAPAQAELDGFIFGELVDGEMDVGHLERLRQLEVNYARSLNADHVLLACTELCYLVRHFAKPLRYEVDSLQALHDAIIQRLARHQEAAKHAL